MASAKEAALVATLVGRLATFEGSHQLPKRRSSATKKKAPSAVSWPHETPAPEELANAGFFYKPLANSHDNVRCFHCKANVDGWEAGDNPVQEHLALSPDCAWAIVQGIRTRIDDPDRDEQDPMSSELLETRIATFGKSWPHEKKKGWKPKVAKMAEAGWFYDPSPEDEDGVGCCYCGLSLDGWEPKDDPKEEHRRRSPTCPFFVLTEQMAPPKKKGRTTKTRGSQASSQASRLSVQSEASASAMPSFSEPPSLMSLGGDIPAAEEDTVLTTATTATTATNKGGKGRAKAAPRAKKGKKAPKKAPRLSEDQSQLQMELDIAIKRASLEMAPLSSKKRTADGQTKPASPSPAPAVEAEPEEREPSPKRAAPEVAKTPSPSRSPAPEAQMEIDAPAPPQPAADISVHDFPMPPAPLSPFEVLEVANNSPPRVATTKKPASPSPAPSSDEENRNPLPDTPKLAWDPVDVEALFLSSPIKGRFGLGNNTDLPTVMNAVQAAMTEAEMKMTVQEWIYFNAEQQEKALRVKTENMIAKFEEEGRRALRVLESLPTSD